MNPQKQFMEAVLGKDVSLNVSVTRQFLTNDGKVLRFYCTWDDKTPYGEKRAYVKIEIQQKYNKKPIN